MPYFCIRRSSAAWCLVALFVTLGFAAGEQPKLVIVDNDFNGPPSTLSNLRAALMFLESSEVNVLAFTVVTGDGWRDEEVPGIRQRLPGVLMRFRCFRKACRWLGQQLYSHQSL
jgi:hypothetical protein